MRIAIIAETKSIYDFEETVRREFSKNWCEWCLLGHGPMCVDRSKCRLDTHEEIYIKHSVKDYK